MTKDEMKEFLDQIANFKPFEFAEPVKAIKDFVEQAEIPVGE